MIREEVLSVVKKHFVTAVDSVNVENVDPRLSMKDLGASSLDIVEVVSGSMKELKVKIPRAELALVKNIDELVDLLYKAKAAAS